MATTLEDRRETVVSRKQFREARWEIEEFNYDYAATLERGEIERWPDYFTDDAEYRVIARDNFESGLPLGLVYCDGKGMFQDRAYALLNTETYAPRYLQLSVTNTRVLASDGDLITAEANFLLVETLVDEASHIQLAGKYYDVFQRTGESLLIKKRDCVYDTVVLNTALVFPV